MKAMIEEYGGFAWEMDPSTKASHALTCQEQHFLSLSPDLLFASNLFMARYARTRPRVRDFEVRSAVPSREARYTGERLDQFDLDVFLTCAQHVGIQPGPASGLVRIDLDKTARELFRDGSAETRRQILASLRRLEAGRIEVRDGRFSCCLRPVHKALHDAMTNRCLVELNPEMLQSLQRVGNVLGFVQDRMRLGRRAMDRWLHTLLRLSPGVCIPLKGLSDLCGNAGVDPDVVSQALGRLGRYVRPGEIGLHRERWLEISKPVLAARAWT